MKLVQVGKETNEKRRTFFETIFGDGHGYVGVAAKVTGKRFSEKFFMYPNELDGLLDWVNKNYHGKDLYFCPQLLGAKKRAKEHVQSCPVVWSDLDECDPKILDPIPSIVVRTSSGRHHAYWLLKAPVEPSEGEDASHRLAYKYEAFGADKSGWDLSQLLRIPLTYNTKYPNAQGTFPTIEIVKNKDLTYDIEEFFELEQVPGYEYEEVAFPKELLNIKPEDVIEKHKATLDPQVVTLYRETPDSDWSSALWHLEMLLLESNLPREDVFVICWNAKCNKYARDKRPPEALWRDVCKADARMSGHYEQDNPPLPDLITPEERKKVRGYKTFVEEYIEWASGLSDASPQYHEAGAFMILSAILAGVMKLKASHGTIIPNLWMMILADTTLTRKSTAMDLAMDLLREVEDDAILATDGSLEGLMSAVATRPGRPGIFWRDEFSGLLDAMKRKDYYAGMSEALTKLYDGKYQKRILRKETIELKNPVLLIFCGGIRSRVFELLDHEHVTSGFLPRFIFIEGEADIDSYKPMGPLSVEQDSGRDELIKKLGEINDCYHSDMSLRIGDEEISAPKDWEVVLTTEAWARYNELHKTMLEFAVESVNPNIYSPTMERLAISTLKAAMLIAASRQDPENKDTITVEEADILKTITYLERWRDYALDVIENVGKTATEKKVEHVFKIIHSRKEGVTRSTVMQNARLTAREADWILETLEQRALIKRHRHGKTQMLHSNVKRR